MPITIVPTQEWEEKQKKRKLKEAEKQPKRRKLKVVKFYLMVIHMYKIFINKEK